MKRTETRKAKIIYNSTDDAYEIWIDTGEGWGFCRSYKCRVRQGGDEPEFIHFSIISSLAEMERFGYEITFKYL